VFFVAGGTKNVQGETLYGGNNTHGSGLSSHSTGDYSVMLLTSDHAPATVTRPGGLGVTNGDEITPDPRFIDRRLLRSIASAMGEFRKLSSTMPVGEVYMFLLAALNEGSSISELAEKADMKMSTASRYLLDLSDKRRAGNPGFGLLRSELDPNELRRKVVTLTPKGRNVIRSLTSQKQAN
jgi:DNA-binding MarR family transcriptional regulator